MIANNVPAGSTPRVEPPDRAGEVDHDVILVAGVVVRRADYGHRVARIGLQSGGEKSRVDSGGPIVLGVNPIAGVDKLPFTKLVAVTVAKPVKLDVPGQVPSATAGPPVNVIQFALAAVEQMASKTAGK